MQSGQKSGLPLNMFLPGKSTEWALSSAPSGSPAPGSRSAWPTWSITSSASHGSKAELRLLDMETVHQGTERPAKTGKTSPYGDPSGRPAQVPPCQPKIVTSFEPSSFPFAVCLVGGEVIGTSWFRVFDTWRKKLEIGFTWYALPYRKGIANLQTKLLLMTFAFEKLGCILVEFLVHEANVPSHGRFWRTQGWHASPRHSDEGRLVRRRFCV